MKALYFDNNLAKILALKLGTRLSQKAVYAPWSPLRWSDVPEPSLPNSRWLKVKNIACGLCGTDIHFMFMDMDPACFPAAVPGIRRKFLGHELVGVVTEAGTDSGAAAGQRVVMRIDWPSCFQLEIDPPCSQCASGNYMLCENQGLGTLPVRDVGGGFSPYMVMHRTQPFFVPVSLTDDQALLLEPVACAVHGVGKAPPSPGDRILVVGGGTLGLLTTAVLRRTQPDARVDCLVRYRHQAEAVEHTGATAIHATHDAYAQVARRTGARQIRGHMGNRILLGGYNIIFDTVGNDRSLHDCLRWVRGKGTVVLMGINFMPARLDYSAVWHQEVRLTGINCHATEADGRTSFDHAAQLLANGLLDPTRIITHRLAVSDWRTAVELFLAKGSSQALKIVLEHR